MVHFTMMTTWFILAFYPAKQVISFILILRQPGPFYTERHLAHLPQETHDPLYPDIHLIHFILTDT